MRWLENRYLRGHLRGLGLEIGALWKRYPVPRGSKVLYMDRADVEDLKKQYAQVQERIFLPDVIGDAIEFPIGPRRLDFLIASHVLEHLPFPLAALRDWYQALTPSGKLLIKVPDKRFTFDRYRQRTPISHLLEEYEHPELTAWREHYAEFVENVDRRKPDEQEIIAGAEGLRTGRFNIHFHAWIDEDLMELVEFTQRVWNLDWKPQVFWKAHSYRKEVTVLLERA